MNKTGWIVVIVVVIGIAAWFANDRGLIGDKQTEEACGKVTIAEMNWASAQLMANVDKIILSKGFGCNVEISILSTFAGGGTF